MSLKVNELSFGVGDTLGHRKKEVVNSFPEITANSPLENTTFVYSVPVMGEWKNGNLLRMLRGMFAQKSKDGEAFEVEVIANSGGKVESLIEWDEKKSCPKKNAQGEIVLISEPENERQKVALGIMEESAESIAFMKTIVEGQRLARILKNNPKDLEAANKISKLIGSVTGLLQREVLEMSIRKAQYISLSLIDTTHTMYSLTDYEMETIFSLRTLGADVARARFEKRPDVVLALFDADTLPENNNSVRDFQDIYARYPEMNYVFGGMSNLPVGGSADFVADGPRANVRRTEVYNSNPSHGSPQISFRLKAYDKLRELTGYIKTGFQGDEDRDTSYRLIYHFGALKDGLLLESCADLYSPTSLTGDRLDGSFDSAGRKSYFEEHGVKLVCEDLWKVFAFRNRIIDLVSKLPVGEQQKVILALDRSRKHFERKQKVQVRLNRMVLNAFIEAKEKQFIKQDAGGLQVNEESILALRGGEALLHYIGANKGLVNRAIGSPEDLDVIKYYLGKGGNLPDGPLTNFQLGIREYIGEFEPMAKLVEMGFVNDKNPQEDRRERGVRVSFMHGAVAEILALGHIYRAFFETNEFLNSRKDYKAQWPDDPDEQQLEMTFKALPSRLRSIHRKVNVNGSEIPNNTFRSVPLFELFKRLASKV